MKNSKLYRLISLLLVLCLSLTLVLAACQGGKKKDDDSNDDGGNGNGNGGGGIVIPDPVKIKLTAADNKHRINYDGSLVFSVSIENTDDKAYSWSFSKQGIVEINNNVLTVINGESLTLDTYVVVMATAHADSTKTASWGVTITAPRKQGQVDNLTSAMIQDIGSANTSITIDGTVTDVYIDNNKPFESSRNSYDFQVKMAEDMWYGSYMQKDGATKIENLYGCGENAVICIEGQPDGSEKYVQTNPMMTYYIDVHNNVSEKIVKNYASIPFSWQSQHLWNHLDMLNIDKFVARVDLAEFVEGENEIYEYQYDHTVYEDIARNPDPWIMTYFSYCYTPMLDETLDTFFLIVKNGAVVGFKAQTAVQVYPEDAEEPDATSYTEVVCMFSDIGTTQLEKPQVYQSDSYTSILQNALDAMAAATNYTFSAEDKQTYGVSPDEYDYTLNSAAGGKTVKNRVLANASSSKGTVGMVGWIDGTTALLCETSKYSYSPDGRDYLSKYRGYRQIDAGHYDVFEYQNLPTATPGVVTPAYVGKQRLNGTIFDQLPSFDIAAELFKGQQIGANAYRFTLQETAITRDVAVRLGLYNASNAEALLVAQLIITVENGKISKIRYPYNISDNYIGYVDITISNVGTTDLTTLTGDGSDPMADYVARQIPANWQIPFGGTGIYYPNDNYQTFNYTSTADMALDRMFSSATLSDANFIQYADLVNAWGDMFSGPFFDFDKKTVDEVEYIRYDFGLTFRDVSIGDENLKIDTDVLEAQMHKLYVELAKKGFVDATATYGDLRGGSTGLASKYYAYVNEALDILIIVETNRTVNFWIDIYNLSQYNRYVAAK